MPPSLLPAIQVLVLSLRRWLAYRLLGLYPPYLGAGVWVEHVARDGSSFTVRLRLWPWTRNYHGTHFGGSLGSMADPFLAIVLIERLGPGFEVWDKEQTIRFRRATKETVRGVFTVPPDRVEAIREEALREGRSNPRFEVALTDPSGEVVAEVTKVVHVRRTGLPGADQRPS